MVRKFFCFDLYTTGLLIGWLGLAESITSSIFSILVVENVDTIITPKNFPPDVDIVALRKLVVTILGTYIAFNIIDLLASGLLIAGTVKRNRLLIIPWLINTLISLLFNAAIIGIAWYQLMVANKTNYAAVIPFVVTSSITFAIFVYAYLAIYSLYEDIRRITPNSEYSSLIDNRNNGTAYPIYTRT